MDKQDTSMVVTTQPALLTPIEVVHGATNQAKLLMDIVDKTKCFQVISGKKYLQVEAWETIGAFNRTHAETSDIVSISKDGEVVGYQAKVNLWKDGQIVGGAFMPCYFSENCCKGKEGDAKHKACMSAAQTFATSKAYRMNYSYIAILAGYQPLPAEEITEDMRQDKTQHWCEEHQTNYFKRGKMKWFAHPIDGSDKWCTENGNKKKETIKQTKNDSEPEEQLAYDLQWVQDSLSEIKWKEPTVKSWLKTKYQVDTTGNIKEVLDRMQPEQLKEFLTEIQERLDMR